MFDDISPQEESFDPTPAPTPRPRPRRRNRKNKATLTDPAIIVSKTIDVTRAATEVLQAAATALKTEPDPESVALGIVSQGKDQWVLSDLAALVEQSDMEILYSLFGKDREALKALWNVCRDFEMVEGNFPANEQTAARALVSGLSNTDFGLRSRIKDAAVLVELA